MYDLIKSESISKMTEQQYHCPVCQQGYLAHTAHLHRHCGVDVAHHQPDHGTPDIKLDTIVPTHIISNDDQLPVAVKVKGKPGRKPKVQ